ncbi:response regulator transcription factor [Chengkuizengella axinellae]|uniref:Response regulator transcription factor n=1 Tax=Chengkuizengella axinellae TaxID=3064388 RepID=A0ABT9J1X5_9BACL|nr:response regulator transcription factor [Chengkuizengella sp. 2205SS18-9]MDP5275592.1 response regulator transcription factor [Chengkuizengella sp. 2205SS18-9]
MDRTILFVEDEERLREIGVDYFSSEGFTVLEAGDGKQALELFEVNHVDLLILDVMLPELDGWAVCKRIRNESDVPIIMLTARTEEEDKLMGFDLGADEYVTKPFSPKVLVARAKTLIKRAEGTIGNNNEKIKLNDIEINKKSRQVKVENRELTLTHKEYELLVYLIENKGIVLTREKLLNQVWGYDFFGDLRTVDTHIKKIRSKLGQKAKFIKTVIRTGYKFEVENEA